MKQLALNGKGLVKNYALVDDEDFIEVNRHNWHALKGTTTLYARRYDFIGRSYKAIYLHRFIMGLEHDDKRVVDHIDGNGLNCQKHNLRVVTRQQNRFNSKPCESSKTSKLKGIYFNKKSGKWHVQITVNSKKIHGKSYESQNDAARAYNELALKYQGEFARLNNVV